ncbi:MAG TPA: alpha/beta hydrolase [Gammaproteobacteria bacterium]|nr:alpha/beta hydrolase [Gammaproteobacteria bacterium]
MGMKVFFIPGLLCTSHVWGMVNNIRNQYDCHDANVTSFDAIEKMSDTLINSMPSRDTVIIGISMGGYVAIDAALKLGEKLKKLILINTTPNAVNQATIPERRKAMRLAEQGAFKEIVAMSKGVCYYNPKKEWMLLEEKMAYDIGQQAYLNQQKAIINRKNYSDLIKNIVADTLIISGKNDKVTPFQDSFFMAEQINNSNLILLNKCGHLSTLEKGNVVEDCIKIFLET